MSRPNSIQHAHKISKSRPFESGLKSMKLTMISLLAAAFLLFRLTHAKLDGYAFDCRGALLGFRGDDQVYCLNNNPKIPCGAYRYQRRSLFLTGHNALLGSFEAQQIDIHDEILVSFHSDLGITCNAVSLDWSRYSMQDFMGLSCPTQQVAGGGGTQENHFSLGVSGDVALRSPLKILGQKTIIQDSYGVYVWYDDETVRLYFGPQQGQASTILEGRLTEEGLMLIDDYDSPSDPCIHDGQSAVQNTTLLPRTSTLSHDDVPDDYRQWTQEDGKPYTPASMAEKIMHWLLLMVSFAGLALMNAC